MASTASRFVPSFTRPAEKVIRQFIRELGSVDRLFVMTGAGISTESGNFMIEKLYFTDFLNESMLLKIAMPIECQMIGKPLAKHWQNIPN